jgi:hypothetical protein
MRTDVLYLCHGRLEFTRATLTNLLQQTDWSLVNEFVVYNDATPEKDGATSAFVREALREAGFGTLRETNLGSPVAVMNHYLARSKAKRFAKIDNDIVVDYGWLNYLSAVMDEYPELELLGMQPAMGGDPRPDAKAVYSYTPCSHIGGVGLMARIAFKRYGRPVPNGRFGFTEWQHDHLPRRGWITPDLRTFALDLAPVEPWKSLTRRYKETPGLQRDWTPYQRSSYYDWWTG